MSDTPKDSIEMESIIEHTYNGQTHQPGDTFHVSGDGGGWSAEMMADSLTAIGHAARVAKGKSRKKSTEAPADQQATHVDPVDTEDLKAVAEHKHVEHRQPAKHIPTVKK